MLTSTKLAFPSTKCGTIKSRGFFPSPNWLFRTATIASPSNFDLDRAIGNILFGSFISNGRHLHVRLTFGNNQTDTASKRNTSPPRQSFFPSWRPSFFLEEKGLTPEEKNWNQVMSADVSAVWRRMPSYVALGEILIVWSLSLVLPFRCCYS